MRYLTGTESEIAAINQTEAIERGCSGTTTQWYATRATTEGRLCLLIDDDKEIPGSVETEPSWE